MTTEVVAVQGEDQWAAALARIPAMISEFAAVRDVPGLVRLHDQIAALERYAEQHSIEADAARQMVIHRLSTERAVGAILVDLERGKGNQYTVEPDTVSGSTSPYRQALAQARLEERVAQRWQVESKLSEAGFREWATSVQEPTSAALRAAVNGAHVGQNSGEFEWYTPEPYIAAAREVMGGIDLDPASTARANEIVKAERFYTIDDDGLRREWAGRVWMNPPYSQPDVGHFCERLTASYLGGLVTEACALTNNATDTAWFATLASAAAAVCFTTGRVRFWSPGKAAAAPLQGQAVTYFGPNADVFAASFARFGWIATIR